ncbi:MAG: ATPase, T2SS/T4P/T4SS family [bacterium]
MADDVSNPLLALVKDQGLIDDLQFEEVHAEFKRSGKPVSLILQDFGIMAMEDILQAMANHLSTDVVTIRERDMTPQLIQSVPGKTARTYQCIPVALVGTTLQIALMEPLDPGRIDELGYILKGKELQIVVADPAAIQKVLEKFYSDGGDDGESMSELLKELGGDETIAKEVEVLEETDDARVMENLANGAPIVRFVNLVVFQAVQDRASDIHFEPFETEFRIRYRVDGALYEMSPPPKHLALPVVSRIKVMANLNISERRVPQDGRINMRLGGNRSVDLRVSTLPTQFGESVVLRVLDRSAVNLEIESLGLPKFIHEYVNDVILRPNGIFVVTGPTGCGKTTTLYSCLRRVNTIDSKLLTAEDPVEYNFTGVNQVQVNDSIGLTFSSILRAMLRQAPNVILVGEIRDLEVAQVAIQAALTGHLVFSTLHTNDAPSAITRLIDLGVKPFLVTNSVQAVMAQRLVRVICPDCKQPSSDTDPRVLRLLGFTPDDIANVTFFRGRGCGACAGTGYRGRQGIFELMEMDNSLRELAFNRGSLSDLRRAAIATGMTTLLQDGREKVRSGITTAEELVRITQAEGLLTD